MSLQKGFLVAAIILFVLAALPVELGFNILAAGLAALSASFLS